MISNASISIQLQSMPHAYVPRAPLKRLGFQLDRDRYCNRPREGTTKAKQNTPQCFKLIKCPSAGVTANGPLTLSTSDCAWTRVTIVQLAGQPSHGGGTEERRGLRLRDGGGLPLLTSPPYLRVEIKSLDEILRSPGGVRTEVVWV